MKTLKHGNQAPHLPPPACRVDTYHRLQNLRWIVFIFVAAFLSGIAAALVTVAWVAPTFVPADFYNPSSDSKAGVSRPDLLLVKQIQQRVVKIYDKRKKIEKIFYAPKALVASAGILSSDGWTVAFYPTYVAGEEKNWEAVDYQGVLYKTTKAIYDPTSRLLYIKLTGQGFRVMSFISPADSVKKNNWWAADEFNGWKLVETKGPELSDNNKVFLAWQQQSPMVLSSPLAAGSFLFNEAGDLAGITDENRTIIPAWLVSGQISTLLEKQRIAHAGAPWRGYMVDGVEWGGVHVNFYGFYVSEAGAQSAGDTINRGDVVLKINGEQVSLASLAEQIFSVPDEFKVLVWRKGKEVELIVKKIIVK